jgi:magnesium and cobalt transporter
MNKKSDDPSPSKPWLERLLAIVAREPQNREQLMEILRDAEERHLLSGEMLGMIERILQTSEMQVREIAVPNANMVVVQKDSKLEDILPIVIESGHSRFPVIGAEKKDIIGILLAKDLLKYCHHTDGDNFQIKDVLRPAFFTSESKRLDILLREFRINRNHIAIVLDEYGHVSGLVTIEDVLEQIVGDIEDEYDIDEDGSFIRKNNENTFIVKAMTPIDEFNSQLKGHFPDDEFDTIGGIVLQAFGHLPTRGETIKLQNYRFKVLHGDNRRIYLLEVKVLKPKK